MSNDDHESTANGGPAEGGERGVARVHYLPTRDQTGPVAAAGGEVMEGELVTEEQYRQLSSQRAQAIARYRGYARDVVVGYRVVRRAATHERSKAVLRHALAYPLAGVKVVAARWRDAHGASRYERMMLQAEMEGNHERLLEWEARDVAEKQRRHQRVMDWVAAPGQWIRSGVLALAGLSGFLLVIGVILAVNSGDIADVIAPIRGVVDAVAFLAWFLTAYGAVLVSGATVAGLFYLYQQGRKHGTAPSWLQAATSGAGTLDTALDESMIMTALRNLGHPALNRKFKEGWGTSVMPVWVQPPLPVGHGWEFALRLPGGVPATSVNARKVILAHNLGRRPEEVWVEVDESDPMAMKCLVLDPGALREPVPDYPLLEAGETDFWTGFPIGIDARWNRVDTPVFERNFVWAGIMGSGKSDQINDLLAGAVLDPVVDIDVFCFAENHDYDWLAPVASTISMGDTAENVAACLAHIQALHDSLTERGQLLRKYDIHSVTRAAAEKDDRLRPRLVVIDECQSFFRQDKPEDRRELVNAMIRFYSAARKYGIVLGFATPTPSDQSLPRDLVAVTSNKSCFAIGDKTRNNVVLGEKAYENGLSALELKPAVRKGGQIVALNDVGTSVTVGFMDQPGLLRSYHLTPDQQTALITRGLELRGGHVRPTPTTSEPEHRNLLADLAAVLGDQPIPAADVPALLARHAPGWAPYRKLTGKALRERLAADYGIKVPSTGNRWPLDPITIRDHLAHRDGAGNGDDDGPPEAAS